MGAWRKRCGCWQGRSTPAAWSTCLSSAAARSMWRLWPRHCAQPCTSLRHDLRLVDQLSPPDLLYTHRHASAVHVGLRCEQTLKRWRALCADTGRLRVRYVLPADGCGHLALVERSAAAVRDTGPEPFSPALHAAHLRRLSTWSAQTMPHAFHPCRLRPGEPRMRVSASLEEVAIICVSRPPSCLLAPCWCALHRHMSVQAHLTRHRTTTCRRLSCLAGRMRACATRSSATCAPALRWTCRPRWPRSTRSARWPPFQILLSKTPTQSPEFSPSVHLLLVLAARHRGMLGEYWHT